MKQSTAHAVKVFTLLKTILTMLDIALTATTAHSAHSRYWSIKWCGIGRGRYRFDTTGTMIFADCPLCEKILKEIVPPQTFLLSVHRFKNVTIVPV